MKAVLKWVGIGFVGLVVLGAVVGGGEEKDATPVAKADAQVQADREEATPAPEAKPEPKTEEKAEPKPEPAPEAAEPEMSSGQQNAVDTAQDYLDYSGFSRSGLIEQLTFEDFSQADATFAVDHVSVDWDAEAVEAAKNYLDYSSFSEQGLIEQLTFEGFTPEQAQYGVSRAY